MTEIIAAGVILILVALGVYLPLIYEKLNQIIDAVRWRNTDD